MEDVGEFVALLIAIPFFAVIWWLMFGRNIIELKNTVAKRKTEESLCFYESSGRLVVKKRIPANAKAIKLAAARNYKMSYKPEELVYTGVSGGGVTVGSVHKEGGYNYVSSAEKTGRYELRHIDGQIRTIEFSSEVLEEAKKSSISKYIDKGGKKIEMFDKLKVSEGAKTALNHMSQMNMSINTLINIATEETKDTYPTYEKCVAIRNWICNM